MNAQAQLCYAELPFVWFTTNLAEQWGEDWNAAPYEHNAERPYPPDPSRGRDYELFRVAIFANPYKHQLFVPEDGHYNSPWSVEDINGGAVPWLRLADIGWDPLTIGVVMAGTTYTDFRGFVAQHGLLIWEEGSIPLLCERIRE